MLSIVWVLLLALGFGLVQTQRLTALKNSTQTISCASFCSLDVTPDFVFVWTTPVYQTVSTVIFTVSDGSTVGSQTVANNQTTTLATSFNFETPSAVVTITETVINGQTFKSPTGWVTGLSESAVYLTNNGLEQVCTTVTKGLFNTLFPVVVENGIPSGIPSDVLTAAFGIPSGISCGQQFVGPPFYLTPALSLTATSFVTVNDVDQSPTASPDAAGSPVNPNPTPTMTNPPKPDGGASSYLQLSTIPSMGKPSPPPQSPTADEPSPNANPSPDSPSPKAQPSPDKPPPDANPSSGEPTPEGKKPPSGSPSDTNPSPLPNKPAPSQLVPIPPPTPTPTPTPTPPPGEATITFNGVPFHRSSSNVIVGSQILTPGAQVTYSGRTVSVDPSGSALVIDSSTLSLPPPGATPPSVSPDANSGGGGEVYYSAGSFVVSAPSPASSPAGVAVITIGSTTVGVTAAPSEAGAASVVVLDGQTASAGGLAITVSGTRVSLASDGRSVVVGTQTETLDFSAPPAPLPPTTEAVILGSQTLVAGGPAVTISGVEVSLLSGGTSVLVGTEVEPLSPVRTSAAGDNIGGYIWSALGGGPPAPSASTSTASGAPTGQPGASVVPFAGDSMRLLPDGRRTLAFTMLWIWLAIVA